MMSLDFLQEGEEHVLADRRGAEKGRGGGNNCWPTA